MEKVKDVYVYDIETLSNFFSYVGKNKRTGEVFTFYIWENHNDLYPLLKHLSEGVSGMVGFNNVNFDYPVMHYIIQFREMLLKKSGSEVARLIYQKAQHTISLDYSAMKESEVLIPQLDLFRIWHYDNKARMTSLKKLEIAMNFDNVQDMPIKHSDTVTTEDQVRDILTYNVNDVEATFKFYELTEDKINLRRGLIKQYGLKCINYSDSKIGEELMLKLYCGATNKSESKVKKLRTYRSSFKFAECIPEYIKFTTPEFNDLLEYLKGIEVDSLKESFKYSIEYNGFTYDLGTGGIHGSTKSGVYSQDADYKIVDCDVSSLYPSLAITLGLYPEHLGEQFPIVYEENLLKPRLEAKKNGDKVMDLGFKLSLNSVYGKSNSEFSWLYDPLYTIRTTLAGQLALCMLSEMLNTRIPNLKMIQINTDGLTVMIPKKEQRNYLAICQEWEKVTSLGLEYVGYTKMVVRDVNNYLSVSKDGKVKRKGTFKLNTEMRKDGEYHKSFSQGVVPIALTEFYINGTPVEETVMKCDDVFEFTKMANSVGKWSTETFEVDEEGNEFNVTPQQKNNRYLLTNSGVRFRKCTYKPDKETGEDKLSQTEYEADKLVTILNEYTGQKVSDLDINYQYYIDECYKIIHLLDGTLEREEIERKEKREKEQKERQETNFLKFCVNKIPTERQWKLYRKEWLIEKYIELNQHENFYTFIEIEQEENEEP